MSPAQRIGAALTALAVVLAACAGGADQTASTIPPSTAAIVSTTVRATPTTLSPSTTVADGVLRMPLTGVPVASAAAIPQRPALAVKIPIDPSAQPWAGLNSADIVFETIINAGYTRLIAVFHSTDADPVGPIRSGRAHDIDLLGMFRRPLVAWSGGNPSVTEAMRIADQERGLLTDLNNVGGRSDLYYRRSGRGGGANNLFSSTDLLWSATPPEFAVPQPVFTYLDEGEFPTGEPATEIEIELDSIRSAWTYDADSRRYLRRQAAPQQNLQPSQTEGAGQVWADNIVIVFADYGVNQADGNPELQSRSSNPVLVLSHGTVRAGVWLRFEPTDPWLLVDNVDDRNPIGLVPGRTWVEIPRNDPETVTLT